MNGKYSPEEMLEYAKEHDMDMPLFNATMYNHYGYSHFPCEGTIKKTNEGYVFIDDNNRVPEIQIESAAEEIVGRHFQAEVTMFNDEYYIHLVPDDTDEMSLEDCQDAVADNVMMDFIEKLGIDIVTKLHIICADGIAMSLSDANGAEIA